MVFEIDSIVNWVVVCSWCFVGFLILVVDWFDGKWALVCWLYLFGLRVLFYVDFYEGEFFWFVVD